MNDRERAAGLLEALCSIRGIALAAAQQSPCPTKATRQLRSDFVVLGMGAGLSFLSMAKALGCDHTSVLHIATMISTSTRAASKRARRRLTVLG
jgi:hypothetical protein